METASTSFDSPMLSNSTLWVLVQSTYIAATILYTCRVVPKHVFPLIHLAYKGHDSKLVLKTPSFDVYSNTAGYKVGLISSLCMQLFLALSSFLPMLVAFVVVPAMLGLALYTTLTLSFVNYQLVSQLPFLSQHQLPSPPLSLLSLFYHYPNNSSTIALDTRTISWLLLAGLVFWGIHISQLLSAKLGFYSELSVSRSWITGKYPKIGTHNQPLFTPLSKSIFVSTILVSVSCLLYFVSGMIEYTLYFYCFHAVTYLLIVCLTFAIFASFASVFEIREALGICHDEALNKAGLMKCKRLEQLNRLKGMNFVQDLSNRPDSVSSFSSANTVLASNPTCPFDFPYMDESRRYCYRGFMTLDPKFLYENIQEAEEYEKKQQEEEEKKILYESLEESRNYVYQHEYRRWYRHENQYENQHKQEYENPHKSRYECRDEIGNDDRWCFKVCHYIGSLFFKCLFSFLGRDRKSIIKTLTFDEESMIQCKSDNNNNGNDDGGIWVDEQWLSNILTKLQHRELNQHRQVCQVYLQKGKRREMISSNDSLYSLLESQIRPIGPTDETCSSSLTSSTCPTCVQLDTDVAKQVYKSDAFSDILCQDFILVAFKESTAVFDDDAELNNTGSCEVGLGGGGSPEHARAIEEEIVAAILGEEERDEKEGPRDEGEEEADEKRFRPYTAATLVDC